MSNILFDLINRWSEIFYLTLTNEKIIWITYPIYITWITIEIFEENEPSHGHAIVNGVINLWVSIDWLRHTIIETKTFEWYILLTIFINFFISIMILRYALKKSNIANYIGKTRVVSYFQISFSPLIYKIIPFDILSLISIFFMFPIVFLTIELIKKLIEKYHSNRSYEDIF